MARSRLLSIREKREYRQAIGLILVTLILVIGFVFWGLPFIARLVGNVFVKQGGEGSSSIIILPTPPVLSDIPEATNSATVAISGFAQPGVELLLFVNDEAVGKELVNDTGIFNFPKVSMNNGVNTVYAVAKSHSGQESEKSRIYAIQIDTKNPELLITAPNDGGVFYGEKDRVVSVIGSTDEENVKVYIGERMVILKPDKTFTLSYQMMEGDQDIKIKVIDPAGNETDKVIKVRWER